MQDKSYIYEQLSDIMVGLSFRNCRRILMYAQELKKIEKAQNNGQIWEGDGILQQLLSEHTKQHAK